MHGRDSRPRCSALSAGPCSMPCNGVALPRAALHSWQTSAAHGRDCSDPRSRQPLTCICATAPSAPAAAQGSQFPAADPLHAPAASATAQATAGAWAGQPAAGLPNRCRLGRCFRHWSGAHVQAPIVGPLAACSWLAACVKAPRTVWAVGEGTGRRGQQVLGAKSCRGGLPEGQTVQCILVEAAVWEKGARLRGWPAGHLRASEVASTRLPGSLRKTRSLCTQHRNRSLSSGPLRHPVPVLACSKL